MVDDCIAKGVRGICVISAGFGETGAEGAAREAELLDEVRDAGCRLIGPNCMGLLNTDPRVRAQRHVLARLSSRGQCRDVDAERGARPRHSRLRAPS